MFLLYVIVFIDVYEIYSYNRARSYSHPYYNVVHRVTISFFIFICIFTMVFILNYVQLYYVTKLKAVAYIHGDIMDYSIRSVLPIYRFNGLLAAFTIITTHNSLGLFSHFMTPYVTLLYLKV